MPRGTMQWEDVPLMIRSTVIEPGAGFGLMTDPMAAFPESATNTFEGPGLLPPPPPPPHDPRLRTTNIKTTRRAAAIPLPSVQYISAPPCHYVLGMRSKRHMPMPQCVKPSDTYNEFQNGNTT